MSDAASASPSRPAWKEEIEALQDQSREAFLRRDVDRLSGLWAEEFMVNSPMGRVLEKAQALDLLAKGVISHASYEEHIEAMERSGGVVVVMGRDVITDAPGGPPVPRRFTNVWAAWDGSWRLLARHAHPLGKP